VKKSAPSEHCPNVRPASIMIQQTGLLNAKGNLAENKKSRNRFLQQFRLNHEMEL
jgi:hypothetical protein